MKNVLLILILLSGFSIHSIDAQKCCLPGPICPPGCCKVSCASGEKRGSASIGQSGEVLLASMMLLGSEPDCKMSQKEMKACMAACKAIGQKGPDDNSHVADAGLSANQGEQTAAMKSPSCHPGCQPNPSCLGSTASAGIIDQAVKPTRVKEKS